MNNQDSDMSIYNTHFSNFLLTKSIGLLLVMILISFSEKSKAQSKEKEATPKYYRIHNVLAYDYALKGLKDSIPLYAFNFKITVKKTGKKQVVKVTASDSLAYSLFPSYKKYHTFDFSPYMNKKNEVSFILPIIVVNKVSMKYKPDSQLPSIDINTVIKLFEKILYVEKPYPNTLILEFLKVEKLNIPKK